MHTPEKIGGNVQPSTGMTEQQLIQQLGRKGISVRLLCLIGLPEARQQHMADRLARAREFKLPTPDEIAKMSEQDLDIALIKKGLSIRLLSLIGLPEARVAAKREAVTFSE